MAEAGGEVLATRVAFLELKDERRLIQEGYELLDEKRVLLATEIMRQLRNYASLQQELERLGAEALAAFEAAVGVHGFDELTVEPKFDLGPSLLDPVYAPDQLNDDAFRRAVRNGVEETRWDFGPMPANGGLGDEQIDAMLGFVRASQGAAATVTNP